MLTISRLLLLADPWNWNAYLFPAWLLGVLFRRLFLFPIRVTVLVMSNIFFLPIFFAMGIFMKPGPKRSAIEQQLITVSVLMSDEGDLLVFFYLLVW